MYLLNCLYTPQFARGKIRDSVSSHYCFSMPLTSDVRFPRARTIWGALQLSGRSDGRVCASVLALWLFLLWSGPNWQGWGTEYPRQGCMRSSLATVWDAPWYQRRVPLSRPGKWWRWYLIPCPMWTPIRLPEIAEGTAMPLFVRVYTGPWSLGTVADEGNLEIQRTGQGKKCNFLLCFIIRNADMGNIYWECNLWLEMFKTVLQNYRSNHVF